jgi:succinoglycan biosynthesis transport protein ExoP
MEHPFDRPGQALPGHFDALPPPYPYANSQTGPRNAVMRRRVIVFFSVFTACALASLTYNFMRPATYVASARLQVTPTGKLAKADAPEASNTQAILVELQVLNSRPLLEKVVARLTEQGALEGINADAVLAVQDMLKVTRVEGTGVIQIEATGPQRLLLPRVVNLLIEVYGEQQALAGKSTTQTELSDAREEVRVIEARLAEKKRSAEAFRLRSNIVSAERDENQDLARLKGLGTSLSAATDREAIAVGKVHALEQAIKEDKRAALAKESPTVANMEQRLSQLREEWRALERQFTPQYLEFDPNARALKTRIGNLEQQLEGERRTSQQNALADAKEELAGVQAATRRLQQQLAEDRQTVQTTSRNLGEFRTMQDELRSLEQMRLAAQQRLLGLEASETARKPRTQVLELAVAPETAWRPLYWRDAGISLAASLLLGFLAVWFVEFFNRAEPMPARPSTVIIPQPWVSVANPGAAHLGAAATRALLSDTAQAPLLAAPQARELADDELRSLLANAAPENLPLLLCLLSGLSAAGLVALRVAHVDTSSWTLSVPGEPGQSLPIEGPLRDLTARCAGLPADTVLFPGPTGEALSEEDVRTMVTVSAHDANLMAAQDITPETLRHTYVAFLVRQGLRFSDLVKAVGRVPADALTALATLAPGSKRLGLEAVDRMLPAVRDVGLKPSQEGLRTG